MAKIRKTRFKDWFLAILVIVLILSVFSALSGIFSRETKTISPFSFSLGKINADGSESKSDTSIVSDFITCDGLKITINPENKVDYWVFYYDENKTYLGSTVQLSSDYDFLDFENAKYARVFIVPELKEDQENIRFWEVFAYAKILTVTVSK